MTRRQWLEGFGLVEWLRPGEYRRAEQVAADLQTLGVGALRTGVSWADWHTSEGEKWYHWLLPMLAREVELLPCFLYTPPSLGVHPKTSSPPRYPKTYADFLDQVITDLGDCFTAMELWNEPNNLSDYDWTLDTDWQVFSEMVGGAAYWVKQRGKTTVLGGMSPPDPNWLRLMGRRGVLQYIDIVGLHGFPGSGELGWQGWSHHQAEVRKILDEFNPEADIWITEAGFSTWRHDDHGQLRHFLEALDAGADRLYWYSLQDLHPRHSTVDGFHSDQRDYHFGLKYADGKPKLLFRLLAQEGVEAVREVLVQTRAASRRRRQAPGTIITGGAGFIGCNLADRLLREGRTVTIYDNFSRPGVERNVRWLRGRHGEALRVQLADVRNEDALQQALAGAEQVYHLAAQVAVTTSLLDPATDFEINARGTLNLLQALAAMPSPPPLVFTSTNKVYGSLQELDLRLGEDGYRPAVAELREHGLAEAHPLDFRSPYGCSKGAADQYVLEYSRTYGLTACVFRMSCIYGPRQLGTEDQGWVAHFLNQVRRGETIAVYGDGQQVRDILYIDDLVNALLLAQVNIERLTGQAFNIGGGSNNAVSLLQVIELAAQLCRRRSATEHQMWRAGDQRYFVADTRRFGELTGWQPRVSYSEGVRRLYSWLSGEATGPVQTAPEFKEHRNAVFTSHAGGDSRQAGFS